MSRKIRRAVNLLIAHEPLITGDIEYIAHELELTDEEIEQAWKDYIAFQKRFDEWCENWKD